ncbi:MAG: RlmE family RNA methyltransferase [Thermoplasmata archaeon]|nr:RlmE family RNA methyltransferase [Candidatus Sysuiplasma acidicola]MBX8645681.1 RlmE family RNA methyltransferase [Candidatus Sysuiplasma acidicola]
MGRRWMKERKRDYYYLKAKREHYRSRAAFKLMQLQDKFSFMFEGMKCVDLGAAPGGWLQVEKEIAGENGTVVGVDIAPLKELDGVTALRADVTAPSAAEKILGAAGGRVDVVLSDMAPNISGNYDLDHERSVALVMAALGVARLVLARNGNFVAKLFEGRSEKEVVAAVTASFKEVRLSKPVASRKQSSETYVIAMGFRG